MSGAELSGVIAVNKPRDWTSFDVIGKLRGVLHIKRLGHGGTLDPMATGVLPVFVGKATRCCDILPDKRKCYRAGFRFGLTSDTQDITGRVLSQSDEAVSREDIERLLPEFTGDIMQLPPMYSAVKIGGKKLVDLAREGREVERRPRPVTVTSLTLTEYDPETREGILEIDCMQGTYVRTIIDDIGGRLGCGGVMTSLIRTRSGGFELSDCHTIEEIAAAAEKGQLEQIMLPTDRVFALYPQSELDGHCTAMYKNGVKLRRDQAGFEESGVHRIYGSDGGFLGLAELRDGELRAVKNFY
jgi:tRNA pseudouridine55 synthase